MYKAIRRLFTIMMMCVILGVVLCEPLTIEAKKETDEMRSDSKYDSREEKIKYYEAVLKENMLSAQEWRKTAVGKYPIDTESIQWKELSYDKALSVCNMPEEYAKSLTTIELVDYAMNYPFLMDILLFDSIEDGINHLVETSEVFQELFSRDDYMDEMLKEYNQIECDYEVLERTKDIKKSNYNKKIFMEAYVGVNYKNIPEDKKEQFIKEYDKKFVEMPKNVKNYNMSSIFYRGIQEMMNYIPQDAIPESVKKQNIIDNVANELSFVKTTKARTLLDNGGIYDYGYEIIDDKLIYCYQLYKEEYNETEKELLALQMEMDHPSFIKMKDATKKYNCHSYAWYSTSMFNNIYIGEPKDIILDTEYYDMWYPYNGTPEWGSKIVFFKRAELAHSAIITSYPRCKSKLGSCGVYSTTISEMELLYGSTYTDIFLEK